MPSYEEEERRSNFFPCHKKRRLRHRGEDMNQTPSEPVFGKMSYYLKNKCLLNRCLRFFSFRYPYQIVIDV